MNTKPGMPHVVMVSNQLFSDATRFCSCSPFSEVLKSAANPNRIYPISSFCATKKAFVNLGNIQTS